MSLGFDPYYTWLAIPPEEQPPHLYRLLGVKPLEENLDVIETAADRQMKHLRDFQSGKNADACQKLLNEISAAKLTLLTPAKKTAYDAELRKARRRQASRGEEDPRRTPARHGQAAADRSAARSQARQANAHGTHRWHWWLAHQCSPQAVRRQ